MNRIKQSKQSLEITVKKWSGRADLAGKRPRKGAQYTKVSPLLEVSAYGGELPRPVRLPHPLGGVTKSYDLFVIASPSCSPAGVRPLNQDLLLEFFGRKYGRGEPI